MNEDVLTGLLAIASLALIAFGVWHLFGWAWTCIVVGVILLARCVTK